MGELNEKPEGTVEEGANHEAGVQDGAKGNEGTSEATSETDGGEVKEEEPAIAKAEETAGVVQGPGNAEQATSEDTNAKGEGAE